MSFFKFIRAGPVLRVKPKAFLQKFSPFVSSSWHSAKHRPQDVRRLKPSYCHFECSATAITHNAMRAAKCCSEWLKHAPRKHLPCLMWISHPGAFLPEPCWAHQVGGGDTISHPPAKRSRCLTQTFEMAMDSPSLLRPAWSLKYRQRKRFQNGPGAEEDVTRTLLRAPSSVPGCYHYCCDVGCFAGAIHVNLFKVVVRSNTQMHWSSYASHDLPTQ